MAKWRFPVSRTCWFFDRLEWTREPKLSSKRCSPQEKRSENKVSYTSCFYLPEFVSYRGISLGAGDGLIAWCRFDRCSCPGRKVHTASFSLSFSSTYLVSSISVLWLCLEKAGNGPMVQICMSEYLTSLCHYRCFTEQKSYLWANT